MRVPLVAREPPLALDQRQPADRSVGVVASPTLSWAASDPDPGDTLAYDVYLGTAFDLTGQSRVANTVWWTIEDNAFVELPRSGECR